jgi:hypothetical protein
MSLADLVERSCVVCGLKSNRVDWQSSDKPACDSHTAEEILAATAKDLPVVSKGEAAVHAALSLKPGPLHDIVDDLLDAIEDLIDLNASPEIIEQLFDIILLIATKQKALSATLYFRDSIGELLMNVTVHLNDAPLAAVQVEFDGPGGTGNIVPNIGPTSYTSSDPTVATVDPVTGNLAYLKAGVTTITGVNAGNGLTSSGTLTIISGLALSAELEFVNQTPPAAKPVLVATKA